MIWSIDEYQGMFSINRSLVERLTNYLDERETDLGINIIRAVHLGSLPPLLEPAEKGSIRFSEAVEEFGKKIHRIKHSLPEGTLRGDLTSLAVRVNELLWEYAEILEGAVTELFQQLDQISFEQWNADLAQSVTLIRDALMHRLEDLIWGIKRLEHHLQEYREISRKEQSPSWKFWNKIKPSLRSLIDPSLNSHLSSTQQELAGNYQQFMDKFSNFFKLYDRAEKGLRKFYDYKVFVSMDLDIQDKLKQIELLLNLWEYNLTAKTLPPFEPVWVLRNAVSPYQATQLYQEYFEELRSSIFEKSRLIKKKFQVFFQDKEGKSLLAAGLLNYRTELDKLRSMIIRYRDFLQKTEQGFSPESQESKALTNLVKSVLNLDVICEKFHTSLEKDSSIIRPFSIQTDLAIQRHLHEMAQPLASKDTMYSEAEAALELLNELDELGTYNPYVVNYVGNSFSKAMRADWKYHVLQEIPLFHQLYDIHQQVMEPLDDRQHLNRLNKFKKIIEQLEYWIKKGEVLRHTHDIELDFNDLKGYLQDFFARVQQIAKENGLSREEALQKIAKTNQKLLEYRYLFAKFFHQISKRNPEEGLLRKRLLFVDQYFESIDTRLQEMRKAYEGV